VASTSDRASDGSHIGPRLPPVHTAFVGRGAELERLKAAFEATVGDQGSLVMLVGEPGIGKTALCGQFASFVDAQGGLALFGHCYPEGSAGVPYQPFVEAFEAFARKRGPETLRAELGSSAGEVARIVPSLRTTLQVESLALENPEDDRLRLLSGLLDSLRNIGAIHPLLLVIEDLHDADRGTLDLLVYLARHLAGTPVLVVGTYRDVDVDRAHPLAAALAELRRVSQFERVQVGELSVDEVQRLMATSTRQSVPRSLAELVHRRSGGNALFTHELLRFLLSERLVEERDGVLRRAGEEASLAREMPEGLRDVVGRRLSRLSPATNQMLRVASVIGREFELEVLRRVQTQPDDELESALAESVGAAILQERSVIGTTITYRFSHAFFQQTLYDEIVAPRRIRLHQQVARALEDIHRRRVDDYAAELAEHYAFSADPQDLAKAVHYAEVAARRATDVFAYGEAARHLERALVVQDLVDLDDRAQRCDLLLSLGEALFPAGENERVSTQVAPDAFSLAEGIGDRSRAFRASRLALDSLFASGPPYIASQPAYLTWAERATRYAAPASVERCHADLALATARFTRGQFAQARELRLEALALARQCADPEALFSAAYIHMGQLDAPRHWDERVALVDECAVWPSEGVSSDALGNMLWYSAKALLAQGERARAEDLWRQLRELAERTHVATVRMWAALGDIQLAVLDGHLEDAWSCFDGIADQADESAISVRTRGIGLVELMMAPSLYLGRAHRWLEAFDQHVSPTRVAQPERPTTSSMRLTAGPVLCLAQVGRIEEARTLVAPLLDNIEGMDDEFPFGSLHLLLQSAIAVEHRAAAQALAGRLACVAHLNGDSLAIRGCVARHLGDAAALVGERASARAYYLQALEAAGKIRFRPEIALAHLRLADLLLADGDKSEALEHLDLAIPELRDMKMQPALERGLNILQRVEHRTAAPTTDAEVTHILTGREREVARLLAAGRSNREVADTLVITEGTVEVHVKHILSKLGLKSRAQVAAWAANESL
jgi:DNA-binding CsgD family transcriptional regulator/tetratricopeptide (TPR) repeat protein